MHIKQIIIIGAGGHALVVLDALLKTDVQVSVNIRDDNKALMGKKLLGHIIQGTTQDVGELPMLLSHVALGDNKKRQYFSEYLLANNKTLETIIHVNSVISPFSTIAPGCFIAAMAIIAPKVSIGMGSIINHGAIIDHDCKIGSWCHVAPNATLGGGVVLGNNVFVGAGAVILPGVEVHNDVVIGAGAVVTKNVLSNKTIIGIPAKELQKVE